MDDVPPLIFPWPKASGEGSQPEDIVKRAKKLPQKSLTTVAAVVPRTPMPNLENVQESLVTIGKTNHGFIYGVHFFPLNILNQSIDLRICEMYSDSGSRW